MSPRPKRTRLSATHEFAVEDRIAPDALTAKRVSGVGLMGDVGAEDPKCAVAYWGRGPRPSAVTLVQQKRWAWSAQPRGVKSYACEIVLRIAWETNGAMSLIGRYCSLIPGLDVKLFTIILAGPTVLSAVGARPPHDGVR